MRTPNTQCMLCSKPLYRRPSDLARARFSACMACRAQAQSVAGVTDAQQAALKLGRPKGTNHRTGCTHKPESKQKIGEAGRRFWANHPEAAMARGAKIRGELHASWRGGASRLNTSIRQMTENRRWMEAIRERDGACRKCSATGTLESHHSPPLAALIERLGIRCRDDARQHADVLWDLAGGMALCQPCHYAEHGRTFRADR